MSASEVEKKSTKRKASASPEPEHNASGEVDEDTPSAWPLNSHHLEAGDLALILYDGRMLEAKVNAVSMDTITFHISRTQLKDIDYPWSETAHPSRAVQALYDERFKNKEMKFIQEDERKKQHVIEIRWKQSDPSLAVFAISRSSSLGPRHCLSFWKQFQPSTPKRGDEFLMIPQGIRYTDNCLTQQKPSVRLKRVQINKIHESGLIRVSYLGSLSDSDDEIDVVSCHTLLFWKCVKSASLEALPAGFEFTPIP